MKTVLSIIRKLLVLLSIDHLKILGFLFKDFSPDKDRNLLMSVLCYVLKYNSKTKTNQVLIELASAILKDKGIIFLYIDSLYFNGYL